MSKTLAYETRVAMGFAQMLVAQFKCRWLDPEQLLYGLAKAGCVTALTNLGISESYLLYVGSLNLSLGSRKISEFQQAPYSNRLNHVLQDAAKAANRLKSAEVRPEHVLLGLLRDSKGGIHSALRRFQVSARKVRQEIFRLLKNPTVCVKLSEATFKKVQTMQERLGTKTSDATVAHMCQLLLDK